MSPTKLVAKRARKEAAQWLLPPIVQQVVYCLESVEDVLAFLDAVPPDACNEALDTLRTLVENDAYLWPVPSVTDLAKIDASIVSNVLPALHMVQVDIDDALTDFCRRTPLPATTLVRAGVSSDLQYFRLNDGHWISNIDNLGISVKCTSLDTSLLQQTLAACTNLQTLAIEWEDAIDQDHFDKVMAAITASCPRLPNLILGAAKHFTLPRCESLLAWLARPSSRKFELICIDFAPRAATSLAIKMLSSTTLHTLTVSEAHHVLTSCLDPSAPPLPRQLRHLTFGTKKGWRDVASFAGKLAPSAIQRLDLRFGTSLDISSIMAVVPPTVRTLKLDNVGTDFFPALPELQYVRLRRATLANEAIVALTALLATSTSLVRLDLEDATLPEDQLQLIHYALPRWLSRQQHACTARLHVTEANVAMLAAVMIMTRNTQFVHLELCDDDACELVAQRSFVTALGTTSRMRLRLLTALSTEDEVEFEEFARLHHVECARGLFHSPKCTPWMPL
ncbi:hypothetical protein SDRG_02211 [Saprolegnia diclina VS20]|uniref:F-box domain-containing protein n=1 Tax=Saprolegnia diclina (strain VS20) TaxID=1156394 RepID=T0QQ97_SAPDV|nr:hypothetical protein SDRG_02211 [Saprolegnia diclina VS20]EQC40309.1 hypothetical protein SDRG_02211 [Saprolegnia diclina VS20]|eukprot:XP_008606008.1 hypothetical protein SDRG_02211 [Saprolegnia diclina VS20]